MTQPPRLDYDKIAPQYNQRYDSPPPSERINALFELVQMVKAQRILEVGCGTGFWLDLLAPRVKHACGLDYSSGMLEQAKGRPAVLRLARGDAICLPYRESSFDLVYCVDALHHFGNQLAFIQESFRVLRPGGALAVLGSDPHSGDDRWYVHDYFEGVREFDLKRFSSAQTIMRWMSGVGFQHTSSETVEWIRMSFCGEEVFADPFLKKNATSQLALLEEESYQSGIARIREAIANAEERGEEIIFDSVLGIKMLTGFKPA